MRKRVKFDESQMLQAIKKVCKLKFRFRLFSEVKKITVFHKQLICNAIMLGRQEVEDKLNTSHSSH